MDRQIQARKEEDPILLEATEWFLELREGNVSSERITLWQQWLANTTHQEAFARVESLWAAAASISPHWPTEAELARDEYTGDEGISAWQARADRATVSAHKPPPQGVARTGAAPWARAALTALAAAAAIAGLILWPWIGGLLQGQTRLFVHTRVGESRTLTLRDGTVIDIGGDTSLVAVLRAHSRTVSLTSGEAYFRVKRDPSRPFTVHAGRGTVTDLGTAFDVRHVQDGLVVSVAEGVVRVATPPPSGEAGAAAVQTRLTAGERLEMEPSESVPQISSIDPALAADWRHGHLHYLDEPLGNVVADLERYSHRRIILPDPQVARLRVTAVVSVQDIPAWLASLSTALPVRVLAQTDEVLIEPLPGR